MHPKWFLDTWISPSMVLNWPTRRSIATIRNVVSNWTSYGHRHLVCTNARCPVTPHILTCYPAWPIWQLPVSIVARIYLSISVAIAARFRSNQATLWFRCLHTKLFSRNYTIRVNLTTANWQVTVVFYIFTRSLLQAPSCHTIFCVEMVAATPAAAAYCTSESHSEMLYIYNFKVKTEIKHGTDIIEW